MLKATKFQQISWDSSAEDPINNQYEKSRNLSLATVWILIEVHFFSRERKNQVRQISLLSVTPYH